MSTRRGVRRPAVDESAHTQQAPLKLHEETWAGLLTNQGLKISQEAEIVPGCAVSVASPSCPDNSPVLPGPGRVIRNMLGWSLMEKTEGSRVWSFPLMKPWCAEGEVPTATNLNLYRGWNSCVSWHSDDEPLFGECGEAKLIVSVSFGSSAVF